MPDDPFDPLFAGPRILMRTDGPPRTPPPDLESRIVILSLASRLAACSACLSRRAERSPRLTETYDDNYPEG